MSERDSFTTAEVDAARAALAIEPGEADEIWIGEVEVFLHKNNPDGTTTSTVYPITDQPA